MLKVTVDNKYTGEGSNYLEAIKNLPEHILTDVYRQAHERVFKYPTFENAEFPLEENLLEYYNRCIDDVFEEAFDFEMEINNHSVKWEEV